jgi:hypothetical protein
MSGDTVDIEIFPISNIRSTLRNSILRNYKWEILDEDLETHAVLIRVYDVGLHDVDEITRYFQNMDMNAEVFRILRNYPSA